MLRKKLKLTGDFVGEVFVEYRDSVVEITTWDSLLPRNYGTSNHFAITHKGKEYHLSIKVRAIREPAIYFMNVSDASMWRANTYGGRHDCPKVRDELMKQIMPKIRKNVESPAFRNKVICSEIRARLLSNRKDVVSAKASLRAEIASCKFEERKLKWYQNRPLVGDYKDRNF